ncbi:Fe2+ transport system protein FeoA [Actinopolyspora biskrensis]|uniref:Fe2+ transport system protein FeoA n=1 Tax=Actinopolyspora biskrensis TaxID=1470178 RepID=A0A852Z4E2_9ACTN|nr:FeoA family protein [Actinopolyspora biskrensis]NYH80609.1 Fe2+ transport system protein FeoA [Actinopolyspora biskrensis]
MSTTLDRLHRGQTATVTALELEGAERRRLMDMGLLVGTTVSVDRVSPLGDPTAYRVRDGLLVLRRGQAHLVHVDLPEGDPT